MWLRRACDVSEFEQPQVIATSHRMAIADKRVVVSNFIRSFCNGMTFSMGRQSKPNEVVSSDACPLDLNLLQQIAQLRLMSDDVIGLELARMTVSALLGKSSHE